MTTNHYISVSRRGELIARRKGQAPVTIAHADHGLLVRPPPDAVERGVPAELRIMFAPGGKERALKVFDVVFDGRQIAVSAFQIEYVVSDQELGGWMRATVDAALDAAHT